MRAGFRYTGQQGGVAWGRERWVWRMRTDPSFIASGCTHHTILPSFLPSFNPTLASFPSPFLVYDPLVSSLTGVEPGQRTSWTDSASIHPGVFERDTCRNRLPCARSYIYISRPCVFFFFIVIFFSRPSFPVITGSIP